MNKQESQNQVSIIIKGVRYDAVPQEADDYACIGCELPIGICEVCWKLIGEKAVFKKSDKKFEP